VIKAPFVSIEPLVDSTLDSTPDGALQAGVPAAAADPGERLRAEVRQNYEFLWRSLRRLGVAQPSVEDAVQEVLFVFARRIEDVRPGAERAFLFSTATRVAADWRKKQRRSREDARPEVLDLHASDAPSAEQLIEQRRARELFDRVLDDLPDDLRAVFILFELEEMKMATIAEMLDLPLGTVASRLRRARAMFESAAERLERTGRRR
jgi:RNA polymerase sigma-70 factor (ECF subfamily)